MRLWRRERLKVSWDWRWPAVGAFVAVSGSKIVYLFPLPFLVVEIRLNSWFANKYGGRWRQRNETVRLKGNDLGRAQEFIKWQLADLWVGCRQSASTRAPTRRRKIVTESDPGTVFAMLQAVEADVQIQKHRTSELAGVVEDLTKRTTTDLSFLRTEVRGLRDDLDKAIQKKASFLLDALTAEIIDLYDKVEVGRPHSTTANGTWYVSISQRGIHHEGQDIKPSESAWEALRLFKRTFVRVLKPRDRAKLVWRQRPELEEEGGLYIVYARACLEDIVTESAK